MRSTAILLLAFALPIGCFRLQSVESELAKTTHSGKSDSVNSADGGTHPSVTSQPDVTPQELVEALKQKGVDLDLSPAPRRDRAAGTASVLALRLAGVGQPPRVLVYLCDNEEGAREVVGFLGEGAFTSGRFAIGPYLSTADDRALTLKIHTALEQADVR